MRRDCTNAVDDENNVDLFAQRAEFDGEHGIMAYNRTLQRPGKANQILPMEEWIVAVGKHPGIIAGSDWVQVQSMLDVSKSKSYRRLRSNVALLSGLYGAANAAITCARS